MANKDTFYRQIFKLVLTNVIQHNYIGGTDCRA